MQETEVVGERAVGRPSLWVSSWTLLQGTAVPHRASHSPGCWAPPPEVLIQVVCSVDPGFAFLTSSQVALMLLF